MVLFTVKSSSPRPPSVMVIVAVLPTMVAGMVYQCAATGPGVGPYFHYIVLGGGAVG